MKKIMRSTIISAILSCILTLMASCSNNDENTASYRKYEIPTDVMIETPDNQILTINTKDDFEKYFKNCVSSAKPDTKIELPEVNFLKYRLIYIQGESTHGIAKLESSLASTESCKILSIHIDQNFTNVMQRWNVAYLIDREDKPNIKLQYQIIKP